MKKGKLLLFLTFFLAGCSNGSLPTSSISSNHPSSGTSQTSSKEQTSITTSSISSVNVSSTSSASTSSSQVKEETTIKKIKETAKSFKGLENSVGVYESNVNVTIRLKLLATLDAITTQKGYGNRYKILMTDGSDYIYLKTNDDNYDYLKKYVTNQGVYQVTGYISLYNNEVELTVENKPVYLEGQTLDVSYDSFVETKSLSQIYDEINSLKLNSKGVAYSKLVKFSGKCLAKDINNTNMYFGNSDMIVNVHGHDKVTNSFTQGSSYTLIASIGMYNFKPSLEFVSSYSSTPIDVSYENLETMTCAEFYKYSYEVDEDSTYPKYSNLFKKPYKVQGYANAYIKGGKEYMVLEDTYHQNLYSTYTSARSAKALFINNENYVGITNSNAKYCPMYDHISDGALLDVIVFPYLWNTQDYPQVYCYSFVANN